MTVFQTIAVLLCFAAIGAYVNNRVLRLPASVGMMLFALLLSWTAMAAARLGFIDLSLATDFVSNIDFSSVFLHGMLSFLLFAGALHVDLNELKKYRLVVAFLATIGVLLATLVTGTAVWWAARQLGVDMPYLYALLFGALISPTDPVAVMGILKDSHMAQSLRLKMGTESLLNDGVGVVAFLSLLDLSTHPQSFHLELSSIVMLIAWEGIGSILLGFALGWLAYTLLRNIDDYKTEVLLTLALASGGYCFAEIVNVSAPITMVITGLMIGNHGRALVMSERTRKHLDMFWELLDDILNAVLFVLIGLELMVIPVSSGFLAIGLVAILATLVGRLVSVALPITLMRAHVPFEPGAIRLLTWGGLRGGISIAMALSLPASPYKNIVLGMTYLTVVFSVLFQGTTFRHVVTLIKTR